MLEVTGLSKRYGSIRALDDVSLSATRGEVVALVGENGAGKSTLVRCIARAVATDEGTVKINGNVVGKSPRDAIDSGLSVVWQDLALCENLDVTANLFLGRELENQAFLQTANMRSTAARLFESLNVEVPELNRPIERLSGGQRQLVAIARATLDEPRVLILDEPTAALGIAESRTVLDVLRGLQERGVCLVLVSHQLDEVFDIADRIVVMRHGQVVANLHRAETNPDDVVAMITGADVDSTAGQQLRRLHSLAEQLADADQSSILPMTVSSLSGALGTDRMALLMIDQGSDGASLELSAGLQLPTPVSDLLNLLPFDASNFITQAASSEELVVVPQLRDSVNDRVAQTSLSAGLGGAWASPIVGQSGTLAVIVGFSDKVTQLQADQMQLLELFSAMAGVALERGRLVETLGGRNRALEGLRVVLESLAGPDLPQSGMAVALDALCVGVAADAAMLLVGDEYDWSPRATSSGPLPNDVATRMRRATTADANIKTSIFEWSKGLAGLVCLWKDGVPDDADQVLDGAANSFRLALERELMLEAEQEAAAFRRSRRLERQLTQRIGHEIRTPLTAIQGFASTLLQDDVEWPESEKARFLKVIEHEAGRMGRLVAQMFDDSALESGSLRLSRNYYDLVAVIRDAVSIAGPTDSITLDGAESLEIWCDADRLEQVFVNLIANAIRHNVTGTKVLIRIDEGHNGFATIVVEDDGEGMPQDAVDFLNGTIEDRDRAHGIGLHLVRGLVLAHDGSVAASSEPGKGTRVTVKLRTDGDAP